MRLLNGDAKKGLAFFVILIDVLVPSTSHWPMKKLIAFAFIFAGLPAMVSAQTTGYKTGERVLGQTKDCYYDAAGKAYTKTVESYQLCPLTIRVAAEQAPSYPSYPSYPSNPSPSAPSSRTGYKTGERVIGQTKECYYDVVGKSYTKTVESYQLCPMTISIPNGY